ncbi:hypothetical protein BIV57_06390 [Mangrovactinospora gilvigrisea]|uniref:PPM-type phosphatase domain-containing protein n=2 Tax=Mangrovactinospora gilvigrisea TaxID=1428644 RepID=A0A1J7CF66_9ACTN|nr:hypothetical protein BIV57_06390 [Mangrovactinospora gilvigrisea]
MRWVAWVPPLIIAVAFAGDFVIPGGYWSSTPLLVAAAPIAAAVSSLRVTVLTAVAAAAAGAGDVYERFQLHRRHFDGVLTAVVIAGLVAVASALVRHRRELALAAVRDVAAAAQRAVLPRPSASVGPFTVAVRYEAADDAAEIGGDLYAVQDTRWGVRFLVGDVRGKGMGAVGAVALLLGAFREAADTAPDLAALVRSLEHSLRREGERRGGDRSIDAVEGFTTALVGETSPDGALLRFAMLGHPPPLLLDRSGHARWLADWEGDLPLSTNLDAPPPRIHRVELPSEALLLLVTDGVTEARNAAGEFYDPVARLAGRRFRTPRQLVDWVAEDVHRHTVGRRGDDMAMLAMRCPAP